MNLKMLMNDDEMMPFRTYGRLCLVGLDGFGGDRCVKMMVLFIALQRSVWFSAFIVLVLLEREMMHVA